LLIKRSFSLAGHRTSVALEPAFWDALARVAGARGVTVGKIVTETDAARGPGENLASLLRVLALRAAEGADEPEADADEDGEAEE